MGHQGAVRTAAIIFAILLLATANVWAHCDTMNGPVVKAGRQALDSKDIRLVLIWVQPANEPEIRAAFDKALAVRALGGEAKELADRYFFETLVRVHRAGEGAPYAGLKEEEVEPGIAAAEHALQEGSLKDLSKELTGALQKQLEESFRKVTSARTFKPTDVEAGRRYVAAYVSYIHFVERLHQSIESGAEGHGTEGHAH